MAARAKEWMNKMQKKEEELVLKSGGQWRPKNTLAPKDKITKDLVKKMIPKTISKVDESAKTLPKKTSSISETPIKKPAGFGAFGVKTKQIPKEVQPPEKSILPPPTSTEKEKKKKKEEIPDLDPNLVGHITLHVPPPPGHEDKLKEHIESMRAKGSEMSIGDTKANLDSLRLHLMTFYSNLYSKHGSSLEDRIDNLKSYKWPGENQGSVVSDSWNDLKFVEETNQDIYDGILINPNDTTIPSQQTLTSSIINGNNKKKKTATDKERNNEEGILGVLHEIGQGIQSIENRMSSAKNVVDQYTENPNLRTWAYNAVPQSKQHPRIGAEFNEHCKTLYRHLYVRSVRNEERIKALKNRIKVIQLQSQNDFKPIDGRRGL